MENHSEENQGYHNTYHDTKVDTVGTFCPAATQVVNHNNFNLSLSPTDIKTSSDVDCQAAEQMILLRRDFNFDEINRKILDAHEVWIFGLGCTITIKLLYDKCINLHSLTQHMRFLFMDSKGHAVRIAAKREGKPNRKVQERYEENWKLIEELATAFPEQIHYKKIDYLPPYNLFIFNPHRDDAELYVHIAGWQSASTDGRPLIVLNKRSHPYWFNYFQSEFNKMWKKEADPA